MTERERIVLWLAESNPDIELVGEMPVWRSFLWALRHPRRFAAASAIAEAADIIYRGDHIKEQSHEPG